MTGRTFGMACALACALLVEPVAAAAPGAPRAARGDLVRSGGVGVFIPPPGHGVTAHADTRDGHRVVRVIHRSGGAIEIATTSEAASSAQVSAAGWVSACKDDAFTHEAYVQQDYRWSFNVGSAPSNVAARAERAVVKGIGAVPAAFNNCGLSDQVDATDRYLGETAQQASIDSSGNCETAGNLANEVSFGDMPRGILGLTCVRYLLGIPTATVVEADIKLNKTEYRWTTRPGVRCRSKLDVRSVVTHESGHAFGLGHVGEAEHGALTMSEVTPYCSTAPRTFGRGDVRGLEALY